MEWRCWGHAVRPNNKKRKLEEMDDSVDSTSTKAAGTYAEAGSSAEVGTFEDVDGDADEGDEEYFINTKKRPASDKSSPAGSFSAWNAMYKDERLAGGIICLIKDCANDRYVGQGSSIASFSLIVFEDWHCWCYPTRAAAVGNNMRENAM